MLRIILRKNILALAIMALGVFSIAYLSKPDRGGLDHCQRIFGFDSLDQRGLELRPFWKWEPFETPKFRMKIDGTRATELQEYLVGCGYTHWDKGGIQYGSLNMGWDGTTDVSYSKKQIGKHVHLMAHDKTNGFLYAIVSQ